MCTEASYSYACLATKGNFKDSSCTLNSVQGSVTGYKDVFNVRERTLMSAVARQPVSIAIEAYHGCTIRGGVWECETNIGFQSSLVSLTSLCTVASLSSVVMNTCALATDHDLDCCAWLKTMRKSSRHQTVVRQVSFTQHSQQIA